VTLAAFANSLSGTMLDSAASGIISDEEMRYIAPDVFASHNMKQL
jgi:hypothetical protein